MIMKQAGKNLFITGIDTGVGKTFISSIFTEALKASYWKPIQCGDLESTDTDQVKSLVSNKTSHFLNEAYRLKTPASPHKAAAIENIHIKQLNIKAIAPAAPLCFCAKLYW